MRLEGLSMREGSYFCFSIIVGGAKHAQTFNFWRIKAMKLLKIVCLFFLLGSDFKLKPASLEAKIQSSCASKRIKHK